MGSVKIVGALFLKTPCVWLAGLVLFVGASTVLFVDSVKAAPLDAPPRAPGQRRVAPVRGPGLPLYFIENRGQTDPRVAYYVQGANKILFFAADGVTMVVSPVLPRQLAEPTAALISAASSMDAPGEGSVSRFTIKLDF